MYALNRITQTGVILLLLTAPALAQEGVRWQTDLEQASRQAAQTGRLVLVHFWADWCQPCVRLEKEVFIHPQVAAALEAHYVPVKLNADHFAATARSYGVDSLPTDVILTPDGKVVTKLNSPMTATAYTSRMAEIATTHRGQPGEQLTQNTPPSSNPQGNLPPASSVAPAYAASTGTNFGPAQQTSALGAAGASSYGTPPQAQLPPQGSTPYTPPSSSYASPQATVPGAHTTPGMQSPAAGNSPQQAYNPYAQPQASADRYAMNASPSPAVGMMPGTTAAPAQHDNPYMNSPSSSVPAQGAGHQANYNPANRYSDPQSMNAAGSQMPAGQDRYGAAAAGDRYAMPSSPAAEPYHAPTSSPYGAANSQPAAAGNNSMAPAAQPAAQSSPYMAPRYDAATTNAPTQTAPAYNAPATGGATQPAAETQAPASGSLSYEMHAPLTEQSPTAAAVDPNNPPLGLDGFCPVTLMEAQSWTAGDRRYGAIHRGRTYLFTGAEQQQRFLANPDLYSPAMAGNDPVLALEQQQQVAGHRRHGVYYRDRIYLFSNEASLARFSQNPEHYAEGVRQAMQQSTTNNVQRH